jgi:hypothetical protein
MKTTTRSESRREFQAGALDLQRRGKQAAVVILMGLFAVMLPASIVLAGNPVRPLVLSCETTFAFNATGAIDIQGTCHYSHLGLTTTSAVQIAIPQPDGSLNIVNTAVYTAANGDELFATFVGTGFFTATGVTFSGVETYTGGSGRFENASGASTLAGSATFTAATSGIGEFSGQGTLSY